VTTPLGFFTLQILVIEGILGSLSIGATGIDRRIFTGPFVEDHHE
jgi:hypothetical protein